jgi:hypothetical protein
MNADRIEFIADSPMGNVFFKQVLIRADSCPFVANLLN